MDPSDSFVASFNSSSRNLQVACCFIPVGRHRTDTDLDLPQINHFFLPQLLRLVCPRIYSQRISPRVRLHLAVSSPAVRPCRTSATINTHLHTPLLARGDKGVGAVRCVGICIPE